MQAISEDEDKRNNSRRTNLVDVVIYIGRIGRHIEREFIEEFRIRKAEFGSAGEFLLELKKEFEGENKESIKVVELKRIEQGEK